MAGSGEVGIAMSGYHLYYFANPYSNTHNKYMFFFKVYTICFLGRLLAILKTIKKVYEVMFFDT